MPPRSRGSGRRSRSVRQVLDIHLLAKRNLMKVMRKPRFIIFSTLQPIMQLILFVFVFGSIANFKGSGSATRTSSFPR